MTDTWQDAPPPPAPKGRRGKYDWPGLVAKMKARPGEWLLIDEAGNRGLTSTIKARRMTALQDPGWDFHVRVRNTNRIAGTCEIWMSAERKEI